MHLYRLTFYSKTNLKRPGAGNIPNQIKSILDTSLANNKAKGITGALIFNKDYFVEVIEGEREEISRAFCSISKDPRHSEPVIIECVPIDERAFDCWSMSYAGKSPNMLASYKKYGCEEVLQPEQMTPASILGLMEDLINLDIKVASDSPERGKESPVTPQAASVLRDHKTKRSLQRVNVG